jgi:cytoskeletal protein RodZ
MAEKQKKPGLYQNPVTSRLTGYFSDAEETMNKSGKNENRPQDQGQESMAGLDHSGTYLRKLRTEKGLSVKEVCETTRISEMNLRAMENQDFAALPAETFTRGLLNNYARFLGADPAHVVARFMRERDQTQGGGKRGRTRQADHHILSPKKLAEPAHISSITMAAVLLLCIVVLFTGFCLYTSWNPFSFLFRETDSIQSAVMHALPDDATPASSAPAAESKESTSSLPQASPPAPIATTPDAAIPDAPVESASQDIPVQDTLDKAAPAATMTSPRPAVGTDRITVEFLKDTRLILTRNNEEPVNATFKKGEKQTWPVTGSMQLTFDQPESAVILANGRQLPFPEETGGRYTLNLPAKKSSPSTP